MWEAEKAGVAEVGEEMGEESDAVGEEVYKEGVGRKEEVVKYLVQELADKEDMKEREMEELVVEFVVSP